MEYSWFVVKSALLGLQLPHATFHHGDEKGHVQDRLCIRLAWKPRRISGDFGCN